MRSLHSAHQCSSMYCFILLSSSKLRPAGALALVMVGCKSVGGEFLLSQFVATIKRDPLILRSISSEHNRRQNEVGKAS